ncbi:unnamed protein product [Cylicocyclus nassatus]|uniref:Uncharacterized protein n=1 Tax=Cylicocyclus nassatus TaxID=53992 RepID=A0AA36GQY4_CYLNA|nr:unnamed protein product [Cylicocyclus nassatus]CAJ0596550.1 unnamed protein product [Cylicocyclus nassatus]
MTPQSGAGAVTSAPNMQNASVAGGLLGLFSSIYTAETNKQNTWKTNGMNRYIAEQNNKLAKTLSDPAYQKSRMRLANLRADTGNISPSVPNLDTPTMTAPTVPELSTGIAGGITAGNSQDNLELMRQKLPYELDILKSQNKINEQQATNLENINTHYIDELQAKLTQIYSENEKTRLDNSKLSLTLFGIDNFYNEHESPRAFFKNGQLFIIPQNNDYRYPYDNQNMSPARTYIFDSGYNSQNKFDVPMPIEDLLTRSYAMASLSLIKAQEKLVSAQETSAIASSNLSNIQTSQQTLDYNLYSKFGITKNDDVSLRAVTSQANLDKLTVANGNRLNELLSTRIEQPNQTLFDLSFRRSSTANFEKLYPIFCEQLMPNDVAYLKANLYVRSLPLASPTLTSQRVKVHFFFVPNCLTWRYWDRFVANADENGQAFADTDRPQVPFFYADDLARVANKHLYGLWAEQAKEGALVRDEVRDVYNWLKRPFTLPIDEQRARYTYESLFGIKSLFAHLGYMNFEEYADLEVIKKYQGGNTSVSHYKDFYLAREEEDTKLKYSSLPIRAYDLIYDEFYRDNNLQDPIGITTDLMYFSGNEFSGTPYFIPTQSGNGTKEVKGMFGYANYLWDTTDQCATLYKPSEFQSVTQRTAVDYFMRYASLKPISRQIDFTNGGLPWSQKGKPVEILMPVNIDSWTSDEPFTPTNPTKILRLKPDANPSNTGTLGVTSPEGVLHPADVSLTSQVGFDFRQLRLASALQRIIDKDSRLSGKPFEYFISHFGTAPEHMKLARPLYLGGTSFTTNLSFVAQTSESTETSPLGNLAANSNGEGYLEQIKYHAQEYGYIIGLLSISPENTYTFATRKEMTWTDIDSLPMPELGCIGEMPVKASEVWATNDDSDYNYLPNYTYLKQHLSSVGGEFLTSFRDWIQPQRNHNYILHKRFESNYDELALTSAMPSSNEKIGFNLTSRFLSRSVYNPVSVTGKIYVVGDEILSDISNYVRNVREPNCEHYNDYFSDWDRKPWLYGDALDNAYNCFHDTSHEVDHFMCEYSYDYKVLRNLPKFGEPVILN